MNDNIESNEKGVQVSFAAIDPFLVQAIPTSEETKSGGEWMQWGTANRYPSFLLELYKTAATFKAVVDGLADYIAGNDAVLSVTPTAGIAVNKRGDTAYKIACDIAFDLALYNGFALQVIRDRAGKVAEIYHLPLRNIRTNKDRNVFWYSEDWEKYRVKSIRYPKFMPGDNASEEHASSIYYYCDNTFQAYPEAIIAGAVKACEIERNIDDYHLTNLQNGFAGSYLVNFNNGRPTDEIKKEIEREFNEKFAGAANAGRIVFSWNASKEKAATMQKLDGIDFNDKYTALAKHCRQQIFTAYRANPNLFGIPTENNGFNAEEYESAFRLFNRTMVRPRQKAIADAFETILGVQGVLNITPFSMDENTADDKKVN